MYEYEVHYSPDPLKLLLKEKGRQGWRVCHIDGPLRYPNAVLLERELASLAQGKERLASNQGVEGSNPSGGAKVISLASVA